MKASKGTVSIFSMGCSKNLVDSERLIHMLEECGYRVEHDPERLARGIAIVNTCGFIADAKEESIGMILDLCQAKAQGKIDKLYVMGCLSGRYADTLPAEIPEVDGWYGKFDWVKIASELKKDADTQSWRRRLTTPPHSAYLKIAEGCNRFCAFCAIPLITGRYKSRPVEEIIEEVKELVGKGVVEFNVLAQDLSDYGHDLYGKRSIARLVDEMAQVPGVKWIRLHYAYPADFPLDLLPVMAKHDNVCKYLDIALQHISDKVLDNMRRHIDARQTRELLDRIRREVPGIALRTTLMTGFPGEGDKEFEELMAFVSEQRFERMGAFAYCEEEDTYAAKHFADSVPQEVKQARLDRLMELQEAISTERNEAMTGKTVRVLVDSADEEFYHCRTEADSPDVDQEVLLERGKQPEGLAIEPGRFYDVEITEALPFDLIGVAIGEAK